VSFRRRDALAVYEAHAGPNMTPMVDVVMVILIFFRASTSLLGPEVLLRARLAADRPGPGDAAAAPDSPRLAPPTLVVRLGVDAGGRAVFTGLGALGEPIEALPERASAARAQLGDRAGLPLVVEAAGDVPYAAVIEAHDALREAGFDRVAIR